MTRSSLLPLAIFFASVVHAQSTVVKQTQFTGGQIVPNSPAASVPLSGVIAVPQPVQPGPANTDQSSQQALNMLKQMLGSMNPNGAKPARIPKDADHATYPYASEGTGGASIGDMSSPNAGQCGSAQNLWEAAGNVTKEGVIPPGQGYDMGAPNWPKLIVKDGGRCAVDFGPGKKSMCTSATAAAFYQHLADLCNRGELTLTPQQLNFLNASPGVAHNAFNGNTYSVALFYSYLGGRSVIGTAGAGTIRQALEQAKPGDVLKFDRARSGHSTIFKGIEGDRFCYWSSNTATHGPGVQCESISSLVDVAVSRFPADPSTIGQRLDSMTNDSRLKSLLASSNGTIPAAQVGFVDKLDCPAGSEGANGGDAKPVRNDKSAK